MLLSKLRWQIKVWSYFLNFSFILDKFSTGNGDGSGGGGGGGDCNVGGSYGGGGGDDI